MEAKATQLVTMDLPSSSLAERQAHAELLLNLEAKRIASSIDVPTLPRDVQAALRNIGQPIRLFGENNANIRDRLRLCLARIQVDKSHVGDLKSEMGEEEGEGGAAGATSSAKTVRTGDEITYTHASADLIHAREFIADYSLQRCRDRLQREKKRRWGGAKRMMMKSNGMIIHSQQRRKVGEENSQEESTRGEVPDISMEDDNHHHYDEAAIFEELDTLDSQCLDRYKKIQNMALEGSQYGDGRPLSAIATMKRYDNSTTSSTNDKCLVVTGGWSGGIKVWDGSSSAMNLLATKDIAHEDRIMGIAMHQRGGDNGQCQIASASIDLTGKIWKLNEDKSSYRIQEMATLKGHAARLCKVAFHPSGKYVGTTSFDHTWRLWDIETGGTELLLQDGHWKEVYGIGFHPDGSLVSTTDFGSVVQVWDLRSGKSACHFLGHAKRVLCTEFSPNGFQLATAGDDGTIKVWDLRQRKQYVSIPAHSNLITSIKFAYDDYEQNGEFLASSSFDGTGKIWSTRNWRLLSTLRGHEGKVMGIDILNGTDAGFVTSGYDKTIKFWQ
jgi:U4/U6 small nuclear ribonucleoprotein PRP4